MTFMFIYIYSFAEILNVHREHDITYPCYYKHCSYKINSQYCTCHGQISCFYRLSNCSLDDTCCETVALALQTPNSPLIELNMSENNVKDLGVKLLSDGLKSPNCHLKILRSEIHSIRIQKYLSVSSTKMECTK